MGIYAIVKESGSKGLSIVSSSKNISLDKFVKNSFGEIISLNSGDFDYLGTATDTEEIANEIIRFIQESIESTTIKGISRADYERELVWFTAVWDEIEGKYIVKEIEGGEPEVYDEYDEFMKFCNLDYYTEDGVSDIAINTAKLLCNILNRDLDDEYAEEDGSYGEDNGTDDSEDN